MFKLESQKMKSVLILTKTNWNEPPRIRHQVTRLLKKQGYQITFVERNSYKSIFIKKRVEENISFYSHSELIHHQLRKYPFIQKANNATVKFYLRKILKKIEFDFIINFCYDYSFLRELASNKKVITIINDDFEAQAKLGMEKQIRNQMQETCKNSDDVLTVSYPLYDKPPDRAVDERKVPELLEKYSNFEHIQYSTLNDLELDDVFCSIVPYNPKKESVQACTVSNKAFNLLSAGLPLVYADLKHLIKAPKTVLQKNITLEDYMASLSYYHHNFYEVQSDIELFLNNHYELNRWKILKQIIEK